MTEWTDKWKIRKLKRSEIAISTTSKSHIVWIVSFFFLVATETKGKPLQAQFSGPLHRSNRLEKNLSPSDHFVESREPRRCGQTLQFHENSYRHHTSANPILSIRKETPELLRPLSLNPKPHTQFEKDPITWHLHPLVRGFIPSLFVIHKNLSSFDT